MQLSFSRRIVHGSPARPPHTMRRCSRSALSTARRTLHTHSGLTELDLQHFASICGPTNLITDDPSLAAYNTDWMRKHHGRSKLVLRPGSTSEVSRILAHCNDRRLAVVPQGGNTGLVGGSVPVADEIVVALSRMNRVIAMDEHAGSLICEAGCVLETLQQYVSERGYTMPIDLGAKGSCQIGGNVATNAGGLRFLRYGSLHGSVLGLEAVLADGTVLDNLTALRKDNTGYDVKQLFIGSEGTLGVVTGCALALPRAPQSTQLAFLGLDSYEAVLSCFAAAKRDLGEVLSAIEFLDAESFDLVHRQHAASAGGGGAGGGGGAPRALLETEGCRHYMLIELSGSNAAHDEEKLGAFLEGVMASGAVRDGTIAQDVAQSRAIWRVREGITEALGKAGCVYKYDVSIPLAELYSLCEVMRARLAPLGALVTGFGHLGDGNLHLNIYTPGRFEEEPAVRARSSRPGPDPRRHATPESPRRRRVRVHPGARGHRALRVRVDPGAARLDLGRAWHRCDEAPRPRHEQERADGRRHARPQAVVRPERDSQSRQGAAANNGRRRAMTVVSGLAFAKRARSRGGPSAFFLQFYASCFWSCALERLFLLRILTEVSRNKFEFAIFETHGSVDLVSRYRQTCDGDAACTAVTLGRVTVRVPVWRYPYRDLLVLHKPQAKLGCVLCTDVGCERFSGFRLFFSSKAKGERTAHALE